MFFAAESSDAAVIAAVASTTATLISAASAAFGVWIAYKTAQLGKAVEVVHKATNHLAEEMGKAKLAQGVAEGTAAGLAQGRAEDRTDFRGKPDP